METGVSGVGYRCLVSRGLRSVQCVLVFLFTSLGYDFDVFFFLLEMMLSRIKSSVFCYDVLLPFGYEVFYGN